MIIKPKQQCNQKQRTSIKTSPESHLHWKYHLHKRLFYFRIYADFEVDYEKDNSRVGDKITNIYKQTPVCNGYRIVLEVEEVLKSGYYKSPLRHEKCDWFVDEIVELENKMNVYFKNTKKDINMTKEDKDYFENNNICQYCEKAIVDNKVKGHCHLTGKYRGPAHSQCNINVKQSQSNFISVILHKFRNYDCHVLFKK